MPTSAKCVYWNRTENLNGAPILLTITKHNNRVCEIVIRYAVQNNLHRKGILLFLIIVLNLVSLYLEIISTNCGCAIFIAILFFIYNIAFAVKRERVLVIESLGYQIEVHFMIGQTVRYIAWQDIKSIFINEVISKQRVVFILEILTKDTAKEASAIIPLFTEIMPRLNCLEAIYQHIENCHN